MWDFPEMGNYEANVAGVLESIDGGMAENTQNSLICLLGQVDQLREEDENHEQGNLHQVESMKNYLICSMKTDENHGKNYLICSMKMDENHGKKNHLICSMKSDENHGKEVMGKYRLNAGWKLCHVTEVVAKRLQNNDQVYQGTQMMDQNQIQDPYLEFRLFQCPTKVDIVKDSLRTTAACFS